MIDLPSASLSATTLLVHSSLAGKSAKNPGKAPWNVQVTGAYDLIFPHLHIDIPTRLEVKAWGDVMINSAHMATVRKHYSNSSPTVIPPVMPKPAETMIGTMMARRIGDNVNVLGYGVGGDAS